MNLSMSIAKNLCRNERQSVNGAMGLIKRMYCEKNVLCVTFLTSMMLKMRPIFIDLSVWRMFDSVDFCTIPRQWQQRELWYQQMMNGWQSRVMIMASVNMMVKDDDGQPVVGSLLDQLIEVIDQPHHTWPMVLRRRFVQPTTVQRAQQILWVRAYLRHLNEVLISLMDQHHRRVIFLNRQDIKWIGQLYETIQHSPWARWIDITAIRQFLYAAHPDVVPHHPVWQADVALA